MRSRPEYFLCKKLTKRLSARQCLLNQGMVKGMRWAYSGTKFKLDPCLDCVTGRRMRAWPPGAGVSVAQASSL